MLDLFLQDFVVGIQETVLVQRFGRQSETVDASGALRRDVYRGMQAALESREIRISPSFSVNNIDFRIVLRRVYHHAGMVNRLIYVPHDAPDARKNPPNNANYMGIQIAAWVCSQHFSSPPVGARIVAHGLNKPGKEPAVLYSVERVYDLMDPSLVETFIADRVTAISSLMDTVPADLPPCDEDQRFATKNDKFAKCRGVCRARSSCRQYAEHLANFPNAP